MSDGAKLAEAWHEWLDTDEAKRCLQPGNIARQYLQNRLWRAFMAGAQAAIEIEQRSESAAK